MFPASIIFFSDAAKIISTVYHKKAFVLKNPLIPLFQRGIIRTIAITSRGLIDLLSP
jgi:hypothetical protein